MKRKTMKRLAAAMMTCALLATMFGMSVFAEEESTPSPANVTITKEITKPENVYAPATTFNFTVCPGNAVSATDTSDAIYAGVADGVYFAEGQGSIISTPAASDIGVTTVTAGTTTLAIDSTKFTAPGIYRYLVKETSESYEGITYSIEEKYFDVYVDKDKNVVAYTFVTTDDPKVKDDGVFTNVYDGTHNLTVSKKVEGNQGNTDKEFDFYIKVSGASGEKYYMVVNGSSTGVELTANAENEINFKLKDGESAVIYGLSATDCYTVREADYTGDGYTTKIDSKDGREKTSTISDDTTVTFTNSKSADTPTGIIMTYAPYILMIAVAAVAIVLFLRRRNRAEF